MPEQKTSPKLRMPLTIEPRSLNDRFAGVQPILKSIAQALKIIGISSGAVGFLLLFSYLHASGGSFPMEIATAPGLVVLAAVFFGMALILIAFLLLPGLMLMLGRKASAPVFESLYRLDISSCRRDYLRDYAIYYLPFHLTAVLFCVAICFDRMRTAPGPWLLFGLFLLPLLLGYGAVHLLIKRKRGAKLARKIAFISLGYSWLSTVWFCAMLSTLYVIAISAFPNLADSGWRIGFVIIVLLALTIHLFSSRIFDARAILLVTTLLIFVVLFFYPGASFWGGTVLRYLGIGGNMPITLLLKPVQHPTNTQSSAERINGCLVITIGNEILIRPTTRAADCKLTPESPFPPPVVESRQSRHSPDYRVAAYERSDVLAILPFENATE